MAKQKADAKTGTLEHDEVGTNTSIHAGLEVFSPSWLPSSDYLLLYFPIKVWLMEPRTILYFQLVVCPEQKEGEDLFLLF